MEKKMLIACLATAVSSVGVLGGVTAKTINNVNEATEVVAEPLAEPTSYNNMFIPGNACYMGVSTSGWWKDAGSTFFFYFFDEAGHNAWTDVLVSVSGYSVDYGAYTLYEGVTPTVAGVSSWTKCIAVRGNGSTTGSWNNKWNQTENINAGNFNFCKITSENSGDSASSTNQIVNHYDRLAVWGGTTGWWGSSNICEADGSTDKTALESAWNSSKTSFNKLGYDVRAYFSNLDWTDGTHNCDSLAEKYDYILQKYTFEDFASRG